MSIKIMDMPEEIKVELKRVSAYVIAKINEVAIKEAQRLTLELEVENEKDAFIHLLDYCYNKILAETISVILSTALEMHADRLLTHAQR